jgi:uncharacterized RDD family membrane protein YckC
MFSYPTTAPSGNRTGRPSSEGPSQPGTWARGVVGNVALAPWRWRLASGAIDYGGLYVILYLFSAMHLPGFGQLLAIAALGVNNVYMQGTTGQSLGKRIVGTQLATAVKAPDGSLSLVYPGIGRTLGRQFAHFIDYVLLLTGFFRPIWQYKYRTWADSIAKTVVISRDADHQLRAATPGSVGMEGF